MPGPVLDSEFRPDTTLFGRDAAIDAINAQLREAAKSHAEILAVDGEAGIGKTALCEHAARVAEADGFRVLRAVAVQGESGFQLAVLSQILRPLREVFGELPPRLRAIARGAVGLDDAASPDVHALAVATLGCLAAAAERQSLLVVIDDAQWIDLTSGAVLGFALRRLYADSVAILLAGRSYPRALDGPWPRLHLTPLQASDASRLLAEVRPDLGPFPPSVLADLLAATAGNPLLLRELAPRLDASTVRGAAQLPDPLPLGEKGRASFGAVIAALPLPTRRALGVVALSGGQPQLIGPVLARMRFATTDLTPARDAGLITSGPQPAFTHPLRRAAAADALSEATRRSIHSVLAELTPESNPERRAWHLDAGGATAVVVAEAMEEAAQDIARHAGQAAAAAVWERSAELTSEPVLRERRMLRAATARTLTADYASAERLVTELLDHPISRAVEAEATVLRCQLAMWTRKTDALADMKVWRDRIEPFDPSAACRITIVAAAMQQNHGALEMAHALSADARRLSARAPAGIAKIAAMSAVYTGLLARGAAATDRITDLVSVEEVVALSAAHPGVFASPAHAAQWQESFDFAQRLSDRLIADARAGQAIGVLPEMLLVQAEISWWTGDWPRARAAAAEGLTLAEQTGQLGMVGFARAVDAAMSASVGRRADCEANAYAAITAFADRAGSPVRQYALRALGLLELGDGNAAAAADHLESAYELALNDGLMQPTVVPILGDLAEAHIRAGNLDRAAQIIRELGNAVERSGSRWAAAVLQRCRALFAPDAADAEDQLLASLDLLAGPTLLPFEYARTQLVLGQVLRRRRRNTEARALLRGAAITFRRLGATAWLATVDSERRAAGDRNTARSGDGSPAFAALLTPQQLQVCLLVAAGATNREAATALFLSPKTVDYHLRRSFTILGIRSRVALARLFAQESTSE